MNYYKKYTPYLFLLPAAAVMIVFFFIPFFQTFGLSFFDYSSSLYNPNFVGADNYIKLFKEPVFYKVMFNTFMYLVIAVPFLVTFPHSGNIDKSENKRNNSLQNTLISSGNCVNRSCSNCF